MSGETEGTPVEEKLDGLSSIVDKKKKKKVHDFSSLFPFCSCANVRTKEENEDKMTRA